MTHRSARLPHRFAPDFSGVQPSPVARPVTTAPAPEAPWTP